MDTQWFTEQLVALQRDLEQRIAREAGAARETGDDVWQGPDEAVVEQIRDDELRLAQTDTEILQNVRDALRRIREGTYGRCIVDGAPIAEARLRAVPWTPYCAKHQEQAEQAAGLRTPRL